MNAETLPVAGLMPDSTYVDIDKVPWAKTRFPGIEAKTLMEHKDSGLATLLMTNLRARPGREG